MLPAILTARQTDDHFRPIAARQGAARAGGRQGIHRLTLRNKRVRRLSSKIASMLWLFQAGAIALLMQGIAVSLTTLFIFVYARHTIESLKAPADNAAIQALIPLLQLSYLATAVGVAATRHRFVDATAARIRRASWRKNPSDPDRVANILTISLWFAAMGFVALALGAPPSFLTAHRWRLGYLDAAPILWSGMLSIAAASFGANAQAAALKP